MRLMQKKHELFMVPLKDLVVYPRMVVPFFVGRRRSVRSVEESAAQGRPLFLVAQKKTAVEEPGEHDVHARRRQYYEDNEETAQAGPHVGGHASTRLVMSQR